MTDRRESAYRRYRQRGAGPMTAALLYAGILLAWLVLRLDSPQWQHVLAHWRHHYPHLAGKRPSLGDPLRGVLQTMWLILVKPPHEVMQRPTPQQRLRSSLQPCGLFLSRLWRSSRIVVIKAVRSLPRRIRVSPGVRQTRQRLRTLSSRTHTLLLWLVALVGLVIALLCITSPFDLVSQFLFVLALWALALLMRHLPGRFPTLMLVILSITISSRYLWWRYTSTLNWTSTLDLVLGLILLLAETYSWIVLILSFIQSAWPLQRKPTPLPSDTSQWPTVDLLIPTYNEDLAVVRTTVLAALGMDWPEDKLKIHILDDGNRSEFRDFAHYAGVGYITRTDNRGAKAGNLNNALRQLDGELVAIFDCDHIPVRAFLQMTVGWFLRDPHMALVQTPHHFFSPDPFEHNLSNFRRIPNEGELFYGLVQDGNDLWDAAFFCGSCAVLRRTALDEIGGFATQTVTEDAHTSLRLHRAGWRSAYIRIPLAAGLATDSLAAHIRQRIRWARGMVQIFRTDNPLLGKGLGFFQRLCYTNAMLHFLSGLPRLVFLTAPLGFLLLHAYVIYAPALLLLLYVLPHMVHASLVNSRIQGAYRRTFWGEIYESVLAWYILWPTTVALFSPRHGAFNVTVKGHTKQESWLDWHIVRPYLLLALLNVTGLGFAVWRLFTGPAHEVGTVIISSLWVIYNLLLIGAAIVVAAEARQVRRSHRVRTRLPAAVRLTGGYLYPCTLNDFSEGGVGLAMTHPRLIEAGAEVDLVLARGDEEFVFPARVMRCSGDHVGLVLGELSLQQQIDFVQCTFARADNWLGWTDGRLRDRPMRGFLDILALGAKGYQRLIEYAPSRVRTPLRPLARALRWLWSFAPRHPQAISYDERMSAT